MPLPGFKTVTVDDQTIEDIEFLMKATGMMSRPEVLRALTRAAKRQVALQQKNNEQSGFQSRDPWLSLDDVAFTDLIKVSAEQEASA